MSNRLSLTVEDSFSINNICKQLLILNTNIKTNEQIGGKN